MSRPAPDSLDLYKLPLSLEALRATPQKARRVYLLAGHISNEINELHRLAVMTLKEHGNPVMDRIANGRGWVILRMLIGKTYEAFRFVEDELKETGEFYRDYLAGPIADDTSEYLTPDDRASYAKLWKRIEARKGLLSRIRNTYGFHYKLLPYLDKGLEGLDEGWDLSTYSGCHPETPGHHSRHAGFIGASEHVIIRAMLSEVGENDLVKAMDSLAEEVTDAAGEICDFMGLVMVSILTKHDLLGGQKGSRIFRINGVPSLKETTILPMLRD
jgi:hypothetical protein